MNKDILLQPDFQLLMPCLKEMLCGGVCVLQRGKLLCSSAQEDVDHVEPRDACGCVLD